MKAQLLVLISIFLPFFIFTSCKNEQTSYVEIELNSDWELKSADDSLHFEASVPGTLLGDLYKNEEIDNPYIADNINTLKWIDQKGWIYSTLFDVPADIIKMDNVNLSIGEVKGIADVVLNDSLLGTIHGYFDSQVFNCKKKLKVRGNKLLIRFRPVAEVTRSLNNKQADWIYPSVFQGTTVSPELLSCGIFEPVKLIAWSGARIKNVLVYTDSIENSKAVIKIQSELESVKDANYEVEIYINERKIDNSHLVELKKGMQTYKAQVTIPNPELWWCNGMGKPAIYELTLILKQNKKLFDQKRITFGIRKIELSNPIDSVNSSTHIRLNDQAVFIKGANYLPLNLLKLEPNAESYEQLISKAAAANLNLLRVWGGGVYEKKLFYDLCDKYGIMVWQDIANPDLDQIINTSAIPNSIKRNIDVLRNHPSVALFFGAMEQMNTIPPLDLKRDDKSVIHADSMLAELIRNNFPDIPYYSAVQMNKQTDTEVDIQPYWPVWYNSSSISAYALRKKGIVTEFGVQSIPDIKSAKTFDTGDEFDLRSPVTEAHQFTYITQTGSNLNGNQMLGAYLQMYYNPPVSNEATLYLSQIFQADALKFAIENFRVNRPSCMGSIFWHFNDCWPSISWSVVDFYNRNKPGYNTVKKAYQNIAVIPEKKGDIIRLWVVNDSLKGFNGDISMKIVDFNGAQLYGQNLSNIYIKPGSAEIILEKYVSAMFPAKISNKVLMDITLSVRGKVIAENKLYFVDPLFLDLPEPDMNMQITNKENRFQIIIRSTTLVKNLVFFTRDKDVTFADNNMDLLPGKTYTINADYDGTQSEFENDLQVISLVDSF